MNIALLKPMTVSEYIAWAGRQTESQRTELINGRIVPMSPERIDHNRAKMRALAALQRAMTLAGIEGEVFTDGVTVRIDDYTAYEPDASVHCGPPLPGGQMTIPAPIIVVEVLSPSTTHIDTSGKLIGYFTLPSVAHYLIIDPDARTVTHHRRGADGQVIAQTIGAGAIPLEPPGLLLDAAEFLG